MKVLIIIAALFLTACTSTQGLSVFSFTNADAESALKQELPKLNKKANVMGLPVELEIKSLAVDIGPDNRDVIALDLDSSATISAFLFEYPVRLNLVIEGSPFYDSEKKAVFIRNINLADSAIDAGGFKGNLGVLSKDIVRIINTFLETNPVYELDMSNPKIALLSKLPLDMKVGEGRVQIIPRL